MDFTFDAKVMNHEGLTKWYGILSVHAPKESVLVKAWGPNGRISGLTLNTGGRGIIISSVDAELWKCMSCDYRDREFDEHQQISVGSTTAWQDVLNDRKPAFTTALNGYFSKDRKLEDWMLLQLSAVKDVSPLQPSQLHAPGFEKAYEKIVGVSASLAAMSDFGDW